MKQLYERINEALVARGIDAEQVEVTKNGIPCVGFRIITGTNVSPIVYYSQQDTLESFFERINEAVAQTPEFDLDCLKDKEYVSRNLRVSVQKTSNDNSLIKKPVLNIEAFLRIKAGSLGDGDIGSIRVTDALLSMCGVSADDAWMWASINMEKTFNVRSMADVLGLPDDLFPNPFFVVTTEDGIDGASSLMFPEIFRNFCLTMDLDAVLILPSSTQEVLLIPENVGADYSEFAEMVDTVNRTEVDPLIQLDPVVYRYDIESDDIQIVAEA